MQLALIIISWPDNCAKPFRNQILSIYSCQSIRNDGLYFVSKYFFLWENMIIGRVIKYYWWPIRVIQTFLRIPILIIVCVISYPLKLCIKQRVFNLSFGGFFLAFKLGLPEFLIPLMVLNFFLTNSVVGALSHLILNVSSLESFCKDKPPNIRVIAEADKRWVQNPSGDFFTFCKINV